MALRDFLGLDSPFPVACELGESLTEILSERSDGTYDTDQVLLHLALAISNLEAELVNTKAVLGNTQAYVLELEARILNAGLRLKVADSPIHGD